MVTLYLCSMGPSRPSQIVFMCASRGLQLFKHSSVTQGQSFRNCSSTAPALLPMGGSFPALLPHQGILLLGCSSSLACSCKGSPRAVSPSGLIHFFSTGFSMAVCGDLLCVVSVGCRGTACSIVDHSWASGIFCSMLAL